MIIPVAHDYSCPWCWIGLLQADQLRAEFGVEFDWLAYELYPEELELGTWTHPEEPPDKPPVPTRMELAYAAQGIERPTNKGPYPMRTHKVHEATEYAKATGGVDELVSAFYHGYYEQAADLDDIDVLANLARPIVSSLDEMLLAVSQKRYKANIIGFDEGAYRSGVYNVPTFYIGGERYAEQPYVVLQRAMKKAVMVR